MFGRFLLGRCAVCRNWRFALFRPTGFRPTALLWRWVGRNRAQRQFRHGGWVSRSIGRPDCGASPFHFVSPSRSDIYVRSPTMRWTIEASVRNSFSTGLPPPLRSRVFVPTHAFAGATDARHCRGNEGPSSWLSQVVRFDLNCCRCHAEPHLHCSVSLPKLTLSGLHSTYRITVNKCSSPWTGNDLNRSG